MEHLPTGKVLNQFWMAFSSVKLEDTRTRLTTLCFSEASSYWVYWPRLKSLSHANRVHISPTLFISSHPPALLDLSGCAGASQKIGIAPPHPPPPLTLSLSSSQIKQRLREGDFFGSACASFLYPEAGEKKERGGGLVGGEHSIWGLMWSLLF